MPCARACLVMPAALTLVACGGGAAPANDNTVMTGNATAGSGQVLDRDTVLAERWQALFTRPDAVIAALNDLGYRASPPPTAARRWTSRGQARVLPKADAPVTVAANVAVLGTADRRVASVRFTFEVRKHGDVTRKRDLDAALYPNRLVRGFLGRFELQPTTQVGGALRRGESATGTEHGGTVSVVASPLADADLDHGKRLDITISPAGAATPGAIARN